MSEAATHHAGFNKLYEGGAIQEALCMAHIRRKLYDIMEATQSPIAVEAPQRIPPFYGVEKEIRGRMPDERRELRNTRSRPLMDSTREWLATELSELPRKPETAAAIHYAVSRWNALVPTSTMAASNRTT